MAGEAVTSQSGNGGASGNSTSNGVRPPAENGEKVHKTAGITFAGQDKLPKLPVPELKPTVDRYLESLKPLQTSREHQETAACVQEFLESDGPELQERLKTYASSRTSYIEQFWYDSYLNYDNPVVLNLNPFFLLEDDPTPARNDQVTRAASLIISSLSFVRAVRKEELQPDTMRGNPLDMYQYSRLFGTARVPTEAGCQIGQDEGARHVVVLCRGQFYWFDVLDDNHDLIMSEKDLAVNLQSIIEDAAETPIQEAAKGALGVLSTENRKTWSGLRDVLTREEDSNNANCLHTVDSALFIVCLDDTEPTNSSDLCQNMLCGTSDVVKGVQIGTCTNRWYDKLQIIVCKNGSAGINFEHTGVDGHTVLRFASDVYTDTILKYAKSINGQAPSLWTSVSPDPSKRDPESFGDVSTTPYKLEWDMTPELNIAVRFAETRLADLLEQNEFRTLDFEAYGKNFITSMGFSPDAFVQMAFQAAYYGMYGRVECTYEPAMTKAFLHGRTEAIRSVTNESVDFVRTFWGDNPNQAKVDALRKAATKHTANTKECAKGLGSDRHLYALYCLWQRGLDNNSLIISPASTAETSPESGGHNTNVARPANIDSSRNGDSSSSHSAERSDVPASPSRRHQVANQAAMMPSIFADPGWDKINMTILSTSNCGNPALRQFGFGPTSGDGFGIGYIIKDDRIAICASSKHRQTKRFVDAIESYLLEIRRVLRATHHRKVSHKASRAREIEEDRQTKSGRVKSKGRAIASVANGAAGSGSGSAQAKPQAEETAPETDDEMGGYGFFDAGMLMQALKKTAADAESMADIKNAAAQRRRAVGKKLHLTEY